MTGAGRPSYVRDRVVETLDDFFAIGFDANDALLALGMSYGAVRANAVRAGRRDLADALSAWKKQDAERLQRAKGVAWQ